MTFIVKHVYCYISRISGERLQDHLSSGLYLGSYSVLSSLMVYSRYINARNLSMFTDGVRFACDYSFTPRHHILIYSMPGEHFRPIN